ncbi:MAG: type II CRISPR-associated endonuclease Cas1 [Defluviitaleaceae bacterium]|nr:type II CRISPR-associated endonuclease Cas1 [Defluviitaleaceae bacterium]
MKDIIYIKETYRVSAVDEDKLRFRNIFNGEETYLYTDEISVIIFDRANSYIQTEAIERLLKSNTLIIFCNAKHAPIALISNEYGYYKKLAILKLQLSVSSKTKGRLWRKFVKQKIQNQSDILEYMVETLEYKSQVLQEFKTLIKNTKDHDETNRESVAARRYFTYCFGPSFRRVRSHKGYVEAHIVNPRDQKVNDALNYGYAIIRSIARKSLVANGFEPSFGIHHESEENPFNLSDDIIEPYRQLIDLAVLEHIMPNGKVKFEQEDIPQFIKYLLIQNCLIDNRVYTVHDAIELTVQSLKQCLEEDTAAKILLPSILEP